MKMIQPKPIRTKSIRKAVDAALKATSEEVRTNYDLATWNWKNRPEWKIIGPRSKAGNRELVWETESTPFVFVDQGTEGPYPIVAKNAPTLKFQTGFIPMTQPGRLVSQPGASFGPWASPIAVEHPGIKAREISKQNAEQVQPSLKRHMDFYMDGVF